MNDWFLNVLRCPMCNDTLQLSLELEANEGGLSYGLITCAGCNADFPVVEGIPLLLPPKGSCDIYAETAEDILIQGAPALNITAAIRAGNKIAALSLLLNPISLSAPSWTFSPQPPEQIDRTREVRSSSGVTAAKSQPSARQQFTMPLRRLYRRCRAFYRRVRLPTWRQQFAGYLLQHQNRLSACDVIHLYYGQYSGNTEMGHYFHCRFGMPRTLAALSIAQPMRATPGPLLDVACGAGHLTHFLAYERDDGPVVGVDRDFFRLYLAKRYIAPQAQFACVSADNHLPLADDVFEATLCSDAFHIMQDKAAMLNEFRRVMTDQGSLFLARVANAEKEPHEGYELDVDGYAGLVSDLPCAMLGEDELLARYLQGMGPDLSRGTDDAGLRQQKWLTLVASPRQELFVEHGRFKDWPHAVGRLAVNPVYVETSAAQPTGRDGTRHFEFAFPSDWYEFENNAYRTYASSAFSIPVSLLPDLNQRCTDEAVQRHVARFEVLGMPDRYVFPLHPHS